MNVSVLLHVGLLVEAFAAELARVRTRVGVDEQMCRQRGRSLEALATLATLEAPLGTVHGAVLTQTDGVTECLTACAALVRASTAAVSPSPVNLHAIHCIHHHHHHHRYF